MLSASGDAFSLQLSFEVLGVPVPRDTQIHLMHPVRLDADRIEITHAPNRMETTLPLMEVPA